MKILKYLAIALFALAMVACGDDEPKTNFTREFNMIYPKLPAGHKSITKIEQIYDNGDQTVATATYDGDHLKSIHVVVKGRNNYSNEETINFDYKNGAIICDKSIQDVIYSIEQNSQGAITRLKNVATESTAADFDYNYDNNLYYAQTSSLSSSCVTKVSWDGGNLMHWASYGVNKQDSVVYEYGVGAPLNKGCIDVVGNESFTFTKYVCAIMRNAGLLGVNSAYLPTVIKKDRNTNSAGEIELKRYNITYEFDSDGYVKSYTTNESPKYTVKITYR